MQEFNGWEYLLIDAANAAGHDKLTFDRRLIWTLANLHNLENLADEAESPVLYRKAVMAIRDAQAGKPSGHLVAFDAVCSGIQIMSALTGCVHGSYATGLVDPNHRADAYQEVTDRMNVLLYDAGFHGVSYPRNDIKGAVMKSCYGSKKAPEDLFGEGSPELEMFKQACLDVAPGAFTLLQQLLNTWKPYALSHEWILPDNFHAKVKVMETIETRLEVDELNHSTFTYEYKENVGQERGLSNVANVIHSVDGYLLRSLVRRCNYDRDMVETISNLITGELLERQTYFTYNGIFGEDPTIQVYLDRYYATSMVDMVILPYLTADNICLLTDDHLRKLNVLLNQMLKHPPFPVITIHDSFASHPNHMNVVRYWYKEILAEMAEGTILDDIFGQLFESPVVYQKLSNNLATQIRGSNYALS